MADKHVVRFEPVGIEIEVDEDQTILRAAAEQGIMLMHGCKEGQCSSCKSFVLDGEDIELDKYSTFALPDYEREEGFTLLCRAHVYEDVTIELLNFDEDMIRSGPADPGGGGRGRVQGPGHPRHAAPRAAAAGTPGDQVLPRAVRRHRHPGHRGHPLVLDGEHLQPRQRPARVRHQGLPGRALLALPGHPARRRRPAQPHRAVRGVHAAGGPRRRSDLRRRRRGDGADPVAAALDGRARHRPQGHLLLRRAADGGTCASRRNCAPWSSRCPRSVTFPRCPSLPPTTPGTARSA